MKKHRVIALILTFVSLCLVALGYYLSTIPDVQLKYGYAMPLSIGLRWLPLLFFLLVFVREEAFSLWWKFFLPIFLLSAILVFSGPAVPPARMGVVPDIDRTQATIFFVWLYYIVSVLVVGWKYLRIYISQHVKNQTLN